MSNQPPMRKDNFIAKNIRIDPKVWHELMKAGVNISEVCRQAMEQALKAIKKL